MLLLNVWGSFISHLKPFFFCIGSRLISRVYWLMFSNFCMAYLEDFILLDGFDVKIVSKRLKVSEWKFVIVAEMNWRETSQTCLKSLVNTSWVLSVGWKS